MSMRDDLKSALRLIDMFMQATDSTHEDTEELGRLMDLRREMEIDDGDDDEDLASFCEHRFDVKATHVEDNEEIDGSQIAIIASCLHCGESAAKVFSPVEFPWGTLACDGKSHSDG